MTATSEISAGVALSNAVPANHAYPDLNSHLQKMPIASPRYAFTESMVAGAPPDPGVFALWAHDELIYYGRALGEGVTIQSRLREHLGSAKRCTSGCTSSATHYGWEITGNPRAREAELLREHQKSYGCIPRCNAR
jgi:hypothetical protein